jgi:hypothetical protein
VPEENSFRENDTCVSARGHHLISLLDIQSKGLLTKDVLTSLGCLKGPRMMEVIWERDVDGLNTRVV